MALVLVVDDSRYTRRVHGRILEDAGHEVVEAATGVEALESFALRRPDVVLLDLTMPDMGGLEILQKLREIDPRTSAIVVTADVQKSTEAMVRDQGAVAFLGKPADPEQLLAAVSRGSGEP